MLLACCAAYLVPPGHGLGRCARRLHSGNGTEGMMVFPRGIVSLAVDCVVFGFTGERLRLLLIRRAVAPFAGMWALPGGFVEAGETLRAAAGRELSEESGVALAAVEEIGAFDALDRDPRGRVVSVAVLGLVRPEDCVLASRCDAAEARWFDLDAVPALAFDHGAILRRGRDRLRDALWSGPLGLRLLGDAFTLTDAQRLYETIGGAPLDVRNFRKRLLATGLVVPLAARQRGVAHRAARYYACRPSPSG